MNKNNNKTIFNDIKAIFHGILCTFRSNKETTEERTVLGYMGIAGPWFD